MHIQHFEQFDEPINAQQFRDFVRSKGFYGYHPAGYGGCALLVTKIIDEKNNFYEWHYPNNTESSKMWLWKHADNCD